MPYEARRSFAERRRVKIQMRPADNRGMRLSSRHSLMALPFATGCLFVVLIGIVISGCATAPETTSVVHRQALSEGNSIGYRPQSKTVPSIEQRLRAAVRDWAGTPHQMGGRGRGGIDCSGFVQRLYSDLFGIRLPRTTTLQVRTGMTVGKNELHSGDLLFFRPPYKINHVGIYLGNNEFAHASTSKGVTVSKLNNPYWQAAYWIAKRVLPEKT